MLGPQQRGHYKLCHVVRAAAHMYSRFRSSERGLGDQFDTQVTVLTHAATTASLLCTYIYIAPQPYTRAERATLARRLTSLHLSARRVPPTRTVKLRAIRVLRACMSRGIIRGPRDTSRPVHAWVADGHTRTRGVSAAYTQWTSHGGAHRRRVQGTVTGETGTDHHLLASFR